jgi:hypothetical protein
MHWHDRRRRNDESARPKAAKGAHGIAARPRIVVILESMKEKELTDAVAEIAVEDAKFRLQLAGSILKATAMGNDRPAERAAELRRHLPRKEVAFHNQHASPNELGVLLSLRELFGRERNLWNFVDWVWESPDWMLAVEVKVSPKTLFQPDQLDRYTKAAKRAKKRHYGVLALVAKLPSAQVVRPVRHRKGFVGIVTWDEAAPLLRAINPEDSRHATRWQELLDGVTRPT